MSLIESLIETPVADLARRSEEIDCLVVGSGTAGTSTALALAENEYRVVLLEAGPLLLLDHVGNAVFARRREILAAINRSVSYETAWACDGEEPGNGPRSWIGRGWSLVGGRTVFWSGCAPRFNDWDFEDWPLRPADMEPFYCRAEELLAVSADPAGKRPAFFDSSCQEKIIAALAREGLPARPAPLAVDTRAARNGRLSAGFDSAASRLVRSERLAPFGPRGSVALASQTVVTRLRMRGERIDAVEVVDRRTGGEHVLRPRHVALAGGAIQSTRLALASGLSRTSPDVGRYLCDHIFYQGLIEIDAPAADGGFSVFADATRERRFHVQIQGPFQETWYSPLDPLFWLDCDPAGRFLAIACFGVASSERDNRMVDVHCTGRDDPGMTGFRILYRRSDEDRAVIAHMHETVDRIARCLGGRLVRGEVHSPGAALHEVGGLRMATGASEGVTDSYGRFRDIANLSVADASAWRSQGSANPYLTITAWSLRHAEALAAALGR